MSFTPRIEANSVPSLLPIVAAVALKPSGDVIAHGLYSYGRKAECNNTITARNGYREEFRREHVATFNANRVHEWAIGYNK